MRFVIPLILIIVLGYLVSLFFPWWVAAIPVFLVSFVFKGGAANVFFRGFLGLGLVWMLNAILIQVMNGSQISQKMGSLFLIPEDFFIASPILMVVVVTIIGALLGGLSALPGKYFRGLFVDD